jgi:hypothetical protein
VFGRSTSLVRVRAAALSLSVVAALGLWASPSAADDFVPSVSLQTGVTFTRTPGNDSDDLFVAATPQFIYFIEADRALVALTYSFTGSLNTVLPNGIANRLAVTSTYELAPRTRMLFGAEALQALIGNYLLVKRAASNQIGQLPPLNTSLLSVGFTQGVAHELSAVTRLTQGVSGTYVTSLDPDIQIRNYLATANLALDRSWEFDALGGELNLQYARTFFPPLPTVQAITVALGPTWDHDISPSWSTSLNVSAQLVFSPDPGTEARIGPAGRASILYSNEGSGIGADYAGGIEPNILLGTLLQSHQATLRGFTPLSERHNIVLGLSSGYLHGKNVDLSGTGAFDNEFDAILHDADITWPATDFLSFFVRYQFIGQSAGTGTGATPALVRHGALLGAELFASRPPPRSRLPQGRFPQRVDRSDGPAGRPGSSTSGGSGLPQRR